MKLIIYCLSCIILLQQLPPQSHLLQQPFVILRLAIQHPQLVPFPHPPHYLFTLCWFGKPNLHLHHNLVFQCPPLQQFISFSHHAFSTWLFLQHHSPITTSNCVKDKEHLHFHIHVSTCMLSCETCVLFNIIVRMNIMTT